MSASKTVKLIGGCLCGEVAFSISAPWNEFGYCYCKRCRQATGAGRSAVLITDPAQLVWNKGEDKIIRWDMPSAASFATSFCSVCGSPLPRLTRDKEFVVIPAGSIETDIPVKPMYHEHHASKANWECVGETDLAIYASEPE